uniref:Fibrinogen C-terminal domain-containing protein n=1 Tax=Denticeps clupeoides TaxID=299321 RepID=A0AAY4DJV0_9TELE
MGPAVALLLALVAAPARGRPLLLPLDCADVRNSGGAKPSGVYAIYPAGPASPLHVHCDMESDGGGWTVFQRRLDGSVNFYRSWDGYKNGFGSTSGEYWLGLDNIFILSQRRRNELRVDMEDWQGNRVHAQYASFSLDPESFGYRLDLGGYVGGEAGDAMSSHNGMKFTTYDRDQDVWEKNCAGHFMGAFWYAACHTANPNGLYIPDSGSPHGSVYASWLPWKGNGYSLKNISMKLRPPSQLQKKN